ncbi:MAG: 1-acyl-sn-glycerol-3-phosphate acyltransferase [Terrimonas sp.]|nr:1-acyl-sn-glycerol-3-phosphate acyltransferase [Terrimonas sp.]OJY79896.1 MAG: 1-acyl-sn-glycerol-3-phosphate acyltransferase [Sphingobacteriales bacterium 40-81]
MKRLLYKFLLLLYNLYALLLFIILMLVIFPLVIIASFLNPVLSGNIIYRLCMLWADIWFPLVGIFHKNYYETPHNKKKAYLFVTNHISYLDAAVIVKTFRQALRPLGKVEMTKVPVFGYIYKNAIVTVDRDNASDRSNSVKRLISVLQRGISILIFPEGTFNETGRPLKSFYDGAFRIAIETQTPIKPVLFLDTYNRMPYNGILTLNPGKNRSVFLEEIPVEGLTIEDLPELKHKVFSVMEEKLVVYKAGWIRR